MSDRKNPYAGDPIQDEIVDAIDHNLVNRWAPAWAIPYLQLARVDRPIGSWLLLIPCWWGLFLASANSGSWSLHDTWIFVACAAGAFLMRGAGCTWNDIMDRDLDAMVYRTRSRPLPSGRVSVLAAFAWLTIQACAAFAILLTFNTLAITLGMSSILLVAVYPFAKRFTWWPQVFLGLAFNWGALLAWTAHSGEIKFAAFALYLSGICWTLFYDTIYAHQDKEDDATVGIRSTALYLGNKTPVWLWVFAGFTVLFMLVSIALTMREAAGLLEMVVMAAGVLGFGLHLAWQSGRLDIDDPNCCLILFRSNRNAGLIPVLFWLIALMLF